MRRIFTALLIFAAAFITMVSCGGGDGGTTAPPSGSLDASFGTGGKVTTAVANTYDGAYAVAVQADGKIVAAGYSGSGANVDFALARYNTDGSLDDSFGTGGKMTTSIGSSMDYAYAVAIQADGKIVAAGYSFNGTDTDFALARYNTDGSPDDTFDADGKVITAVNSGDDMAYAVAIQADEKIVAAGYSSNGANTDFAVVRYNTDGSLDDTFGSGGKVSTAVGSSSDSASAVAIQPDGKIAAAGWSWNGANSDFALVRYNTNGSLDTSFDTDGKTTIAIGSASDAASAVAIHSGTGKIVAAGYASNGSDDDFAVVRYNADGSLDTSFDADGIVTTAIGSSNEYILAVKLGADGSIMAAGHSDNGSNDDFALVRYKVDGTLDTSFDADGIVTTAVGSSDDRAKGMVIQHNGRIVAAGDSWNGSNYDFALARYWP